MIHIMAYFLYFLYRFVIQHGAFGLTPIKLG